MNAEEFQIKLIKEDSHAMFMTKSQFAEAYHKAEVKTIKLKLELSFLHQYSERIGLDAERRIEELEQILKQ